MTVLLRSPTDKAQPEVELNRFKVRRPWMTRSQHPCNPLLHRVTCSVGTCLEGTLMQLLEVKLLEVKLVMSLEETSLQVKLLGVKDKQDLQVNLIMWCGQIKVKLSEVNKVMRLEASRVM